MYSMYNFDETGKRYVLGLQAVGILRSFFDVSLTVARDALCPALGVEPHNLSKTKVYRHHMREAYAAIEANYQLCGYCLGKNCDGQCVEEPLEIWTEEDEALSIMEERIDNVVRTHC